MGEPLTVAIVGGGPRGLFALESLAVRVQALGACALEIDLYECRERPGAGPNYDPSQPDFLLMNQSAEKIDLFTRGDPCDRTLGPPLGPTLLEWLKARRSPWADGARYVPRARVGEHLEEAYARVSSTLARHGVALVHRRQRVLDLGRTERGWRVLTRGDGRDYHHVLLTTGHSSSRSDRFVDRWRGRLETVIEHPLSPGVLDAVPPASSVALRGFALTAIDTILALTEGRGGRFERRSNGTLRYLAGADPVARLVPFGRTGLAMTPKPASTPPGLEPVWRQAARAIAEAENFEALRARVVDAAARALVVADSSSQVEAARQVEAELRRAKAAESDGAATSPVIEDLRRSVDVATARAPVDAAWALGETWRSVYPAIVERVSHGGLEARERPRFGRLGARMERLAFGPPIENVEKLLALHEADVLDLRFVKRPRLEAREGRLHVETRSPRTPPRKITVAADALIDATMPSPGMNDESSLLGLLLERREIRRHPRTAGAEVDRRGRLLDARGRPWPSLALVGRAAEGCILGHDTLSRTLHPHLGAWALDVLRAARRDRKNAL